MELNKLGELVRFHRKVAGLNRQELAELADVGKTMIFKLEHGEVGLHLEGLLKVLKVLNINILAQSHLTGSQVSLID